MTTALPSPYVVASRRSDRSAIIRRATGLIAALLLGLATVSPAAGAESRAIGEVGIPDAPPPAPEFARLVEVSAESHASGEFTVQDALDEVGEAGGVVKLGEGTFELDRAATLADAPIHIMGQGPEDTTLTGHVALVLSPAPYIAVTDLAFKDLYRGVVLADGSYGHVRFHKVHFTDIQHTAIVGVVPGPIDRLTVTKCRFERVHIGAHFRNRESRRMKVDSNIFRDIGRGPVVLGSGGGDNRYAEITNNHIENVSPGRNPIGILSYVDRTLIENNTIRNVHGNGQHEAISSRGRNTVIRGNTIIDAGGYTGAISLAASGPTVIEDNIIRFTDEHQGRRRGIDCRQSGLVIANNQLIGTAIGINLRRGGLSTVENNFIGDSQHQRWAITVAISTSSEVRAESMRDMRIVNNTIADIETTEGRFLGIYFNIRNHSGEHDTRMDDVVIADNTFRDIHVAGEAIGVHFGSVSRPDSHMKNVVIENNDFSGLDSPITASRHHVEGLRISNNIGVDDP